MSPRPPQSVPFFRNRRRLALAAAALAVVFLGNKGFRNLVTRWLELRRMRQELASLTLEEAALRERVELARRGDRALERAVRKELGYLKPGEVEYRFPPP